MERIERKEALLAYLTEDMRCTSKRRDWLKTSKSHHPDWLMGIKEGIDSFGADIMYHYLDGSGTTS